MNDASPCATAQTATRQSPAEIAASCQPRAWKATHRTRTTLAIAVLGLFCALPGSARQTMNGEWRTYGGDLASTRYSPLDQIDAKNFSQLEIAFRFKRR
jgi:quinoprotein glucose dehydrogenase